MMTTSRSVVQTGKVVGQKQNKNFLENPFPVSLDFRQEVLSFIVKTVLNTFTCRTASQWTGEDSNPPLLSGQSVGGALTSAKSAMSSWFSTLAQPSVGTTPTTCPEPATEVKP